MTTQTTQNLVGQVKERLLACRGSQDLLVKTWLTLSRTESFFSSLTEKEMAHLHGYWCALMDARDANR